LSLAEPTLAMFEALADWLATAPLTDEQKERVRRAAKKLA
jgi:hypothetical protein